MDETATNFKSFIIRNKDQLCHLCLHYLLKEKRVTGNALDPVANFHLTNGASLYRLNFLAHDDVVHNESFGLMVNYLYDLNSVAENSQNYIMDGKMQTDLYL